MQWLYSNNPSPGFEYLSAQRFLNEYPFKNLSYTWLYSPTKYSSGYFILSEELINWFIEHDTSMSWGFSSDIKKQVGLYYSTDQAIGKCQMGNSHLLYRLSW